MQKGNSWKKAGSLAQPQAEQYKSETSKAPSAAKGRQKFSAQNIKEFKYEIDHQIAKCLDTLDRQGLKFLKETLRASKIFGLNTQELANTQTIEEQFQFSPEAAQPKVQSPPKKNNLNKNIGGKKAGKTVEQKKPQTSQKHARNESKNDLGEKIHKRLESLNIKTGKKQEVKKTELVKKEENQIHTNYEPKSANQIAQEIEVEQLNQESSRISNSNASIKITQSIAPQEMSHSLQPIIQPTEQRHQQKDLPTTKEPKSSKSLREDKTASISNKPFCKKTFKKSHHPESNRQINQDYGVQITQEQDFKESLKAQTAKPMVSNRSSQPQHKDSWKQPHQHSEKDKITHTQPLETLKAQEHHIQPQSALQPQMANLIAKINKLSPTKRGKLQRILQKLEQDPLVATSQLSLTSNPSKRQVSYINPYVAQKNSYFKQSSVKEKSNSRSKLQKIQKASSIKGILNKRNQEENNSPELWSKKQSESRIQLSLAQLPGQKRTKENSSNTKTMEEAGPKHTQFISISKQHQVELGQRQTFFVKQENLKQKQESVSPTLMQSGPRLIKIGKKKSQSTNITIKILTNNGHPTLVSLTGITLFSESGEAIKVQQTNLKQPNPKLLKLFTPSGDNWVSHVSNATIFVQNITQPIGGLRIVNFNKSQLQNNKQADLVEIFIQEQLQWRGQLKGGSFKQGQNYVTDIKISSKDFFFPASNSSLTKSRFFEEKTMRQSQACFQDKKAAKEAQWLEKQSVFEKIREIEEEEKNQSVKKKTQSIRSNLVSIPQSVQNFKNTLPLAQQRPEFFLYENNSKMKAFEDQKNGLQRLCSPKQKNLKNSINQNQDILGYISKSIGMKRRQNQKDQTPVQPKMKDQNYVISPKEKHIQKDQEFEQILKNFEERDRQVQKTKFKMEKASENTNRQQPAQTRAKVAVEKSLEQFMKDSLFDDISKPKKAQNIVNTPTNQVKDKKKFETQLQKSNFKKNNNTELDDLIDELNDVVGTQSNDEKGEDFSIPELPKGKELTLVIFSNWGNQHFTGINGIQVFDSKGDIVTPNNITSSSISSQQLLAKLCKTQLLTSDEQMQLKLPISKKSVLMFGFSLKVEIAAIRIWNYNGHRVHSNIGIRKCHIKLDGAYIFSGEIQKSTGSSEDAYKYCEYILFTQNVGILKKISQKDWLNNQKNSSQNQRMLFKSTLQNFHRPATRNDDESLKKELKGVEVKKEMIKMPKRLCFQYQPPLLPEGFVLKFLLYNTWGDHFFIGLNGIEVFNQKGENIACQNLCQVKADPSSISRLSGHEGDKRVVSNLINKRNSTKSDSDIWLTPLLSDVQKIEKRRPNIILMEYNKINKIAGINFFNYTKTPERGVREIEIYLDQCLLYRGYLRKYDPQEGAIHTTINFSKQINLLQSMNYLGYNEDHLQQQVGLVNEDKIIKQTNRNAVIQKNLSKSNAGKHLI